MDYLSTVVEATKENREKLEAAGYRNCCVGCTRIVFEEVEHVYFEMKKLKEG